MNAFLHMDTFFRMAVYQFVLLPSKLAATSLFIYWLVLGKSPKFSIKKESSVAGINDKILQQ